MKNKITLVFLSIFLVFLIACQQTAKKEAMEKKTVITQSTETPKVETSGEAAVDAVGRGINNVDIVEKDLNPENLSDLDSGLADVQNI